MAHLAFRELYEDLCGCLANVATTVVRAVAARLPVSNTNTPPAPIVDLEAQREQVFPGWTVVGRRPGR